ncbi:hypothetical protein [Pseudoduganella violacea]|uniref:Uncharacterized protein n=1 Tax=Pseudoduganella violacea TaxID=1715466 RepID=A0A7W5B7L9_9BURK|nr:hypothetical protein [Pseudoduganella violacea]MBB3118014.1 hypothetical protein [Pseudoduganella violacea]
MIQIEQIYEAYKAQLGAQAWPEYTVPGGKSAVSPDGLRCLVLTDGRYPAAAEGYHVNDTITETEEVLWGAAVVELVEPFELFTLQAGERAVLAPGRPYSVSGKCCSLIHMDRRWDSQQKRYVSVSPERAEVVRALLAALPG